MAIVDTITDTSKLYHDLKKMDRDNFTYDGACALFNYLDELSSDCDDNIEYDPIAWCCEFSEYEDFEEIKEIYPDLRDVDELREHTQVVEFDGGIIIADF